MIYLGISAIWAAVLYLLLRPKQKAELSEYTKALEALGQLLPDSIDRIGNAIQSNLYPGLAQQSSASVDDSQALANGFASHPAGKHPDAGGGIFEAVAPFPLDWENVDG